MYIIGKHFLYRFQQNLNENCMMSGLKVMLTNVHSLILTTDHNNIVIEIRMWEDKLNKKRNHLIICLSFQDMSILWLLNIKYLYNSLCLTK
jgi:hypothetical protein